MTESALWRRIYALIETIAQLGVETDAGGMQSRALEVIATPRSHEAPGAGRDEQMAQLFRVLDPELSEAAFRRAFPDAEIDGPPVSDTEQ